MIKNGAAVLSAHVVALAVGRGRVVDAVKVLLRRQGYQYDAWTLQMRTLGPPGSAAGTRRTTRSEYLTLLGSYSKRTASAWPVAPEHTAWYLGAQERITYHKTLKNVTA